MHGEGSPALDVAKLGPRLGLDTLQQDPYLAVWDAFHEARLETPPAPTWGGSVEGQPLSLDHANGHLNAQLAREVVLWVLVVPVVKLA